MAIAIMNPPMNKKMVLLKYKGAAAFPVMMPISGNSSMGRIAVAANGMASVIHQVAMRTATAAMLVTMGLSGLRSRDSMSKNSTGPRIKPASCTRVL